MAENKLQKLYGELGLCSVFFAVPEKPLLSAFEKYILADGA